MLLRTRPDPTRFMETQRFPGSDRFLGLGLGLFSSLEPATAGLELHEDDIFSAGSDSPSPRRIPNPNPSPNSAPAPAPAPASARGRLVDRKFGILAALPDRPNPNLMPKASISSSSSAMMIPPPAGKPTTPEKVYRSSAPVSIPVVRRGLEVDLGGEEEDDEAIMLPPHEIVARREGRGRETSPMTTFSVLEGAGRTLKGRDLRRVRNAVFRRCGFVD